MLRKMLLNSIFALALILFFFCSHATATSTVLFCLEANCSAVTVTYGGQTHSSSLTCTHTNYGWTGVPAGTYSWSASGCSMTWSGTQTVDGSSTYITSLCPASGGACCSTGCGTGGAYNCSQCGATTTTTTTSATTTTTATTTSATTTAATTTLPTTTGALVVQNSEGTTTFEVSANGSVYSASRLLSNGASAWGSAPFVLGQDKLNRGIIVTDKAASNQKNIYFGWNVGSTHEYAELFALHEGIAYKNLILNPHGAYVGIGTASPTRPLQMGSGAYVSTGGVWTNASSREYKKDIQQLTAEKAMDALSQLNPVEFAYKADSEERHVGFIAEDVPDIVASKDRKGMSSMDVVAVLTKVVQEQQKLIREQKEVVQKQQKTIGELSEKVAELQSRLRPKEGLLAEPKTLKPSDN